MPCMELLTITIRMDHFLVITWIKKVQQFSKIDYVLLFPFVKFK
jgi:hypothetical protein